MHLILLYGGTMMVMVDVVMVDVVMVITVVTPSREKPKPDAA